MGFQLLFPTPDSNFIALRWGPETYVFISLACKRPQSAFGTNRLENSRLLPGSCSQSVTRARLQSWLSASMRPDMYTEHAPPRLVPLTAVPGLPSGTPCALPFWSVWELELTPIHSAHIPHRHLTTWPAPPVSLFSPGFSDCPKSSHPPPLSCH